MSTSMVFRPCSMLATVCLCLLAVYLPAQDAARKSVVTRAVPNQALEMMPVREVTVFKDGSAFVQHEGVLPVDASGNLLMDYLPIPTLGTFWPYVKEEGVRLKAVSASARRVKVERTALNLREALEANIGERARITEVNGTSCTATIVAIPQRSSEEIAATSAPNAPESLPVPGDIIEIQTNEGFRTLPIARIQDILFEKPPKPAVAREEFRNLLTLRLDWQGKQPASKAAAGLAYLQKGIRWIPNYRVTLDGEGGAKVELQATLINEMTALDNVAMNLVVGVPNFAFADKPDPISLQGVLARLTSEFDNDSRRDNMFNNAIMSQAAMPYYERPGRDAGVVDLGPNVGGGENANEDLFLFTLKNVSLKKGERMTVPVAEYKLKYEDVFTLEVPMLPPREVRGNFNNERQREIAKLLAAPKVKHGIRIKNETEHPFTTAPAMLFRGGKALAQCMMTYTPSGGKVNLEMTDSINIEVTRAENEANRVPNAAEFNGDRYQKVNLTGKITLNNRMKKATEVEVTRVVVGEFDSAGSDGKIVKLNPFEKLSLPAWWEWYDWPWWWSHFNSVSRATWKANLEPGKAVDLEYAWHYYWR